MKASNSRRHYSRWSVVASGERNVDGKFDDIPPGVFGATVFSIVTLLYCTVPHAMYRANEK